MRRTLRGDSFVTEARYERRSAVVSSRHGLRCLERRQRSGGSFAVRVGLPVGPDQGEEDPSIFATSIAGSALAAVDEPAAAEMADRAARYLREHMEPYGVWRHWTRDHPQHHALPADLDDTA